MSDFLFDDRTIDIFSCTFSVCTSSVLLEWINIQQLHVSAYYCHTFEHSKWKIKESIVWARSHALFFFFLRNMKIINIDSLLKAIKLTLHCSVTSRKCARLLRRIFFFSFHSQRKFQVFFSDFLFIVDLHFFFSLASLTLKTINFRLISSFLFATRRSRLIKRNFVSFLAFSGSSVFLGVS